MSLPAPQEGDWTIDRRAAASLTGAAVALFVPGLFLFLALARALRPAYAPVVMFRFGTPVWHTLLADLGMVALSVVLAALILPLHEWCHGLAFRWAGACPVYGAKMAGGVTPVFYATAPGMWFTRAQYAVIGAAPTVVVNLIGLALMWPPTLMRYLLPFPLAVHLSGCVADWWMVWVVARMPARALFQDTEDGFRYVVR
jgi:hypothetical protein